MEKSVLQDAADRLSLTDPAGFRRASPEEALHTLCVDDDGYEAGFCNSLVPVAKKHSKKKSSSHRGTTTDLVQQLIPRNDPAARSTSTVHLCARDGQQQAGMQQIRGYAGLCKRVEKPGTASDGWYTGVEKGLEGADKGFEADKKKVEYSVQHPDELVTSGAALIQQGVASTVQKGIAGAMQRRGNGATQGALKGVEKGFEGASKGFEADKKKVEYSVQHPDELVASGAALVQQGVASTIQKGIAGAMQRRQPDGGAMQGSLKGVEKGLEGANKGFEADKKKVEYSVQHPDELVTSGAALVQQGVASTVQQGIAGAMHRRQPDGGAMQGALKGAEKGFEGAYKGFEADKKKVEYSVQHPDELVTSGAALVQQGVASTVQQGLASAVQPRRLSLLLPCARDEESSDKSGLCDSLIPAAEEREIVELVRRSVQYNAHRRFARPHGPSK